VSTSYFRDKSVLITGASSGIGEEMAIQFASAGAKVILAARRRDLLEALAKKITASGYTEPVVVECDVTRDGDVERAVEAGIRSFGKLDIVVANAGFGVVGAVAKLSVEDYRRQFETNVFGVLRTIFATLPEIKKTCGNLVIMGSVAGWGASPGSSPYAMSKFALRGLAESITPELLRSGVKVTLISPGFVVSNIRRVDNTGNFHAEARDSTVPWLHVPTDVAVRKMLRAIARGEREEIITFHGKALVAIQRFAPWIIRALSNRFSPRSRQ